jgi:hypothetical protein
MMRPAPSFEGPLTTMSPDQLFFLANALALDAWLGLLLLPQAVVAIRNVIAAAVIPCLFATAYAVILTRFFAVLFCGCRFMGGCFLPTIRS